MMQSSAPYRFRLLLKRWKIWLVLAIAIALLGLGMISASAQEVSPSGNQVDGYPIVLDGQELFRVRHGIPGMTSAEERAKILNERLLKVANNSSISPDKIHVEDRDGSIVVLADNTLLFTVNEFDREGIESRRELAEKSVKIIRPAIQKYRQDRSLKQIIQGIIFAILSTIALIVFFNLLQRFVSKLLITIRIARREDTLNFMVRNLQLLGSDATSYLLSSLVRIMRLVLIVGSLYLYIPFVLSQFPTTKAIGNSIFNDTAYRVGLLISGIAQYLPNLALIIVITVITYYLIQFAELVISELGRDDAYPWFYPEWIQPTNRLVSLLLIAIACVIAVPYLPGFSSPAFQGISLFLGALVTLGSSSAIANTIAGIILIYTRSFQLGDVIRLGDFTGEVIEKSLFVTRILTFKKEVITIPNSSVLNGNVINFNAVSREAKKHLLLHTTITLGYDAPWRTVHEVLIQAAQATPGILTTPQPFVLQTALNDYNVSYELNAYSDQPDKMPQVYSELHQSIQDYCNQAGIEILSPAYTSIRDGNHSTIPNNYLPTDYNAPPFQIRNRNGQ